MKQFEFICGGVEAGPADAGAKRFELDVQSKRTVNLRISDISRAMVANIPDLLLDLLEVAAYVYCGDQRATRGTEKLSEAGSLWRRGMRFIIPVRCPDLWSGAELRQALQSTLGFLSDDAYEFEFIPATQAVAEPSLYFPDLSDEMFIPDEVALFSGGIDSLAGALDSIIEAGRKTLLVGHYSAPKVFAVQKELVAELRKAGFGQKLRYVPVNVSNANVSPAETTQRARSFLYASLAFVLAEMSDRSRFSFYENGVVSFNLPVGGDVLGARATRTTHPQTIRGFEHIFSLLADHPVEISTPFLWLTKKEVVERIVERGFGRLLGRSVSCVHPISWTTEVRHCGLCSQCIDRRFAVLAAGAKEFDPSSGYEIDLLTGARTEDADVRMAVAYVKFAQFILNSDRQSFELDTPALYDAVTEISGMAQAEVLDAIWNLHQRHAAGVDKVITTGLQEHSAALWRKKLPRGALLDLCFAGERIEAPPIADHLEQVTNFLDRLEPIVCDFAIDDANERILFRGGYVLDGVDYRLFRALVDNHRQAKTEARDVPYFNTDNLAAKLGITPEVLRRYVSRLRAKAIARLTVDQGVVFEANGFIENSRNEGYRIDPQLREISRADIERDQPMSQSAWPDVTSENLKR